MDDDGLNMRNWGYYEPALKEHLGLQLMPPMVDHRDAKPLLLSSRENLTMGSPNGLPYSYHHPRHSMVSEPPDSIILHMLPPNPDFPVIPDSLPSYSMNLEDQTVGGGQLKKRTGAESATPKPPKPKKPKKAPFSTKDNENASGQKSKPVRRNLDMVINGIDMDISGIPIPVCSCTGVPQQCYRWGCGGWQSACCTTTISMYPLPMSTKRRGARIAGRKMSQGAFKKVLEKLASESYNFANAIDLRAYWAKHGTNKFVTIR
ncbi:hypothetical protein SSX86_016040 [Deinandra increscens subsp. villosa]|uniref:GAGA-binding transcriptional activator n=1 Tax=Deinandra increscens subsp. villosa TaxID=3103831 RepID=A0AAP0D4Q0_9ASTR